VHPPNHNRGPSSAVLQRKLVGARCIRGKRRQRDDIRLPVQAILKAQVLIDDLDLPTRRRERSHIAQVERGNRELRRPSVGTTIDKVRRVDQQQATRHLHHVFALLEEQDRHQQHSIDQAHIDPRLDNA